ncbi:MAG: rod shape-determining protein MreD [Pseudomonadota bacterium]
MASSASQSHLWGMRAAYLLIGLALLFLQLLPLDTAPGGWFGPDFVIALTFVWIARRPEYVPVLAVALLFLLADLLLQRPPGLMSALAILATEALRARTDDIREIFFPSEWAIVGAFIFGLYVIYLIAWSILMPFDIAYGLVLLQMLLTILAYPLVVLASTALFTVVSSTTRAPDAPGGKL